MNFPFIVVLFQAGVLFFFWIHAPFLYFSISYLQYYLYECSTTLHSNIRGMWFSLLLVDFYFTPYNTAKHNNNNGMRHETVWLDRTIHCDSIKNREDGKRSNSSSSYDWKEQQQAHFLPPCRSFNTHHGFLLFDRT